MTTDEIAIQWHMRKHNCMGHNNTKLCFNTDHDIIARFVALNAENPFAVYANTGVCIIKW